MFASSHSHRSRRLIGTSAVLGAVAGLLLLGGCGSDAKVTSTTKANSAVSTTLPKSAIPPPPPDASSVAAYLQTGGAPVVTFERVTAPLAKGSVPSKAVCTSVSKALTATVGSSPDALTTAIKGITDIPVQVAVRQDLQNKLMLLSGCIRGSATTAQATTTKASASVVVQGLNALGISI